MKKGIRIFLIALVVVIAPSKLYSQETQDFNSWSAVELKYELDSRWEFSLEGQLRLKDNASTIDNYFGEFGIQYNLPYNFAIATGFRFQRKNDTQGNIQGYKNRFRYSVDLTFKHELQQLGIKYRVRYQNRNELGLTTSEGDIAAQRIRFKTSFDYNIRDWKLDPQFSAEIFNGFKKNGTDNGFDKYRLSLGTAYKVKRVGKFGLFYRYEREINTASPENLHILYFKYSITL